MSDHCPSCKGPLIEIDRYGELLLGCVECNRWTWRDSETISMALPEEGISRRSRARVRRYGLGTAQPAKPGGGKWWKLSTLKDSNQHATFSSRFTPCPIWSR